MERVRYPIAEVAPILGISRTKVYQRIRRGELSVVRDGGHVFITRDEIERYSKANHPGINEPPAPLASPPAKAKRA